MNDWVEDTLFCVILRKRYDTYTNERNVLFLFRLLAIVYKIKQTNRQLSFKGEELKQLDDDLRCVLECKVVNGLML